MIADVVVEYLPIAMMPAPVALEHSPRSSVVSFLQCAPITIMLASHTPVGSISSPTQPFEIRRMRRFLQRWARAMMLPLLVLVLLSAVFHSLARHQLVLGKLEI